MFKDLKIMKTNIITINTIMEKSLKYLCTVLFLLFIGTGAYAQMIIEEQVKIKTSEWSTYGGSPYTVSKGNISVSTSGVGGTGAYTGGSGSSAYIKIGKGYSVTFSVPSGGKIQKIHFSPNDSQGGMNKAIGCSSGTWNTASSMWTASSDVNSLTMTAPSGSGGEIAWNDFTITVRYTATSAVGVTVSPTSKSWTNAIGVSGNQTFTITGLGSYVNNDECLMSEADYQENKYEDYSTSSITVGTYATFSRGATSASSVAVSAVGTHTGTYSCYLCLHGDDGTSSASFRRVDVYVPLTLTVTGCDDPGKPVITNPISPVSYTTATVSWSAAANATKYDLKIGTTSGGSQFATYSNLTGTSKSLTGLSQGTTYYATVVAKNDCGVTTNTSTSVSFTTLTCPSISGTPSVTISGITGSSVNISYSMTNAVKYTFLIADDEDYPTTSVADYHHGPYTNATASRSYDDLESGKTYYVWVRAWNTCDEGSTTYAGSFTTCIYLFGYKLSTYGCGHRQHGA